MQSILRCSVATRGVRERLSAFTFLHIPISFNPIPTPAKHSFPFGGCSDVVVEYRTRNREVAGSTHTRSTAINPEQVANLLCAQANSASYPQWDGK